jgi:hypothetical protein
MSSQRVIRYSLWAFCLLAAPITGAHAQTFTEVAVGKSHVCGLTDIGEVDCVTDAITKRYDAPAGLPSIKALAAGQQHTCGITLDGDAVCWGGLNYYQEQDVPNIDQPLVSIAAGINHTCAVDETNRAWCWGLDTNEQAQVPGNGYGENGLGFVIVDANATTSCGIQLDGSIGCWSTNPHLSDTSALTGTFVDLDLSDFSGCGLKDTGDIQCWVSAFNPPDNGPYSDLVVGLSSICALDQNKALHCTFSSEFDTDQSKFETSAQLLSLESHDFLGGEPNINICGVTVNAAIVCLESAKLVGVPGMEIDPLNTALDTKLSLTASIYSASSLELFWTPLPGGFPITFVEIYRNNQLVDSVEAQFSWYDNSVDPNGGAINYRIRPVDEFGNPGLYSNTIMVELDQRTVSGDNTLSLDEPPVRENRIEKIEIRTFDDSVLISWEGPLPGENGLKGYEVRVNNEIVVLTDGNVFIYTDFSRLECYVFSVAAISDDNTLLDYRSVAYAPRGRETANCRRG